MSGSLGTDLGYNAGQSTSALFGDSPAISKNNIDSKKNSCRKLTQKSLGFNKLQKSFIRLDFLCQKLKQKSFC